MQIHIHVYDHRNSEHKLDLIISKLHHIMTKQEFADAISAVSDTLQKALTEVTTELANLDNSSPAMDAALVRLQAAAKALDDLNPDAAPPVETPTT